MPNLKNENENRPIDKNVKKMMERLRARFILVSSMEIRAWKAYVIVVFVAGFAAALVWSAYNRWYIESGAKEEKQVVLYSRESCQKPKVGDQFESQIFLDTNQKGVVAAEAVVTYDKQNVAILGIDVAGSDFKYEVKKENDADKGKILVALAQPYPGVNSSKASVAGLSLKALRDFEGPALNLKFDSTEARDDSAAIANDGQGTNILEKVVSQTGEKKCSYFETDIKNPPTGGLLLFAGQRNISLSAAEKISINKKRITFKGNLPELARGEVRILIDGQLKKKIKIKASGYWKKKVELKQRQIYQFQFVFLDSRDEKVYASSIFTIQRVK